MINQLRSFVHAAAILVAMLMPTSPASAEFFDFADGTLQGWTEGDPFGIGGFGGSLYVVSTGGNPGPYMRASDSVPGGGSLAAQAPPGISGDLRRFESVSWDELLPPGAILSTDVLLKGVDGTCYRSTNTITSPIGQWSGREVSLEQGAGWSRVQGTADFESVIANAAALFIELDVVGTTGVEAGADNVYIVPDPVSGVPDHGTQSTTWGAVKCAYR